MLVWPSHGFLNYNCKQFCNAECAPKLTEERLRL
jgi:hypothetical protein